MTKKDKEKPITDAKTLKKMLPTERKAVEILNDNPDLNNNQIGKQLKELGCTRDVGYVSKRLKNSELLAMELTKIRSHNAEYLAKRIVPRALKVHEQALRDRKLGREKKFKWVKLAEDKEFGTEDKRPPIGPTVNIAGIQNLMLNLHKTVAPKHTTDAIDITPESNGDTGTT